MPHVVVAGKMHPAGLARLDAAEGFTYDYVEAISEASYAPLIPQADALVIRTQPLTGATIAAATRLRLVSRHGVGYDFVDVAALDARGVALCIAGDVNSLSVAEHSMMLILACAKRVRRADIATRSGDWRWRDGLEAGEISGKRLLILGYGRSGRRLARMAAGFDMEIAAFDPFLHPWPPGPALQATQLDAALTEADFVAVHAPKSERPLLGAAEFARMKPGVVIVNAARGGIVDEAALAAALARGRVGAAGLDVFEHEPLAQGHPLAAFDNVILTPHIAGVTREAAERLALASVENVLNFFAGRLDPALLVKARPASDLRR